MISEGITQIEPILERFAETNYLNQVLFILITLITWVRVRTLPPQIITKSFVCSVGELNIMKIEDILRTI